MKAKNPKITEEEIALIKSAQAGNMLAFNKLFKKYKHFIDRILFRYLKDIDEAKDLTNVVFLKVYDNLSSFSSYNSFGGWSRIIANRTAVDYLRKRKNKDNVLGESDGRLPSEESYDSPEDEIVNRLTYKYILKKFDSLPETNRKVCKLFYVDNLTVEQISNALSIPIGTIKSILFRTRKRIQKQLKI